MVNGVATTTTIMNSTDEDEKDKTSVYALDTSGYTEGAKIKWRVRTLGILPENYYAQSAWSLVETTTSGPSNCYTSFIFEAETGTYTLIGDVKDVDNSVVEVLYRLSGSVIYRYASNGNGKVTVHKQSARKSSGYSEWSMQRTIDVYAPPTLSLEVNDSEGNAIETLTSFPFYVSGTAGPSTQSPIGYHVSVVSDEFYETIDNTGNSKIVNAGDEVYSKYFDVTSNPLLVELSANNIDLENNITYTITCSVTMNSGLTAEASSNFKVAWTDETYWPNAEIGYDAETFTTIIHPYCNDEYGAAYEGLTLSVYRREFDGGFTELATGISNTSNTYITDPHPALDYARYRIVAVSDSTGAVSFYDVPGYPVGETAVIIQWDEEWTSFDTDINDPLVRPTWSGSLLRLPYNIDVSDSNSADVALVEYIGRKHPVSYYGTQIGSTANWSVEIEKSDKETLYALRRLAVYMGDVYVREPSGSGYWANISVSFSQNHCEMTIPVTLSIKRVSGGV